MVKWPSAFAVATMFAAIAAAGIAASAIAGSNAFGTLIVIVDLLRRSERVGGGTKDRGNGRALAGRLSGGRMITARSVKQAQDRSAGPAHLPKRDVDQLPLDATSTVISKHRQEYRMGKLDGAITVITGAASGIGEATARLFAREGAIVMLVHHDDPETTQRITDEIIAAGGRARPIDADVRDEAEVERVFSITLREFGAPTILVNSAGVDAAGIPVAEMTLDHFEDVLRTNLVGPFLFCRSFVRALAEAKAKGKIINVTSVHEDIPRAGAADYCASKGGLRNLTRCLALELAEHGTTVNNLAPGMVLTPMNQEAIDDPDKLKEQVQSIPAKRAADPGEIAELALYLASSAADYATGATFTLDGGLQMNLGQGA